jgi:hypothetical protein
MKSICYLFIVTFCFITFISKSTNYPVIFNEISKNDINWKIEFQNNEIKVESAIVKLVQPQDGITHEIVIFRYTNLTQKNISLSFNRSSYYGNVCYGCDGKESQFKLDLKPLETIEYKEGERNKTFYLFSKDLKGTIKKELSKFEIINIVTQ